MRGEVRVAADEPEDARQVHDRAAAGRPEARDGVLAAQVDALEIRREDGVPRLLVAALDRPVAEAAPADAGAVEEDVDPVERREGPLDGRGVGEVRLLPVEPDHLGTRSLERPHDRAADAAGRTRHDGDLAVHARECSRSREIANAGISGASMRPAATPRGFRASRDVVATDVTFRPPTSPTPGSCRGGRRRCRRCGSIAAGMACGSTTATSVMPV